MALTLSKAIRPGANIWFMRDGTSYAAGDPANPGGTGAGTSGPTAKAAAADAAWANSHLSLVTTGTLKPGVEQKDQYAVTADVYARTRKFSTKQSLDIDFTCAEMKAIGVEFLFGTQALAIGATQGNPMRKTPTATGWMKLQIADIEGGGTPYVVDVYGQLMLSGDIPLNPEEMMTPSFTFSAYYNTLNTASF